jgi:hypothetical protein
MATSASYDFSVACSEIIGGAMRTLNLIATGESPSTTELSDGREALNMLIKAWQAQDIGLWLNQEATLFLEYEETSYTLGPSGDHASVTSVKTEVATAAAAAALTLILDSVTGMTTGDAIGIELDDGTLQWTTINGVPNTTTLTVTITAALTDDVAVDNHVYTYTDLIQRPLEIFNVRRKDASDYETTVTLISRQEYMALSNKASSGSITSAYYDPQLTNGVLYTWPACNDVQDRLVFTLRRPVMDFDADANDADFPQEWLRALKFNLALELAPEFGIEPKATLVALAVSSKEEVMGFDVEQTSVYLRAKRR